MSSKTIETDKIFYRAHGHNPAWMNTMVAKNAKIAIPNRMVDPDRCMNKVDAFAEYYRIRENPHPGVQAGLKPEPIQWRISQMRGSPNPDNTTDGDTFTCLEFDDTGELLAAGDKSGHITVFKANDEDENLYYVYCAFTSHESEFDYLKSLEIEEKINSINWLPRSTSAYHLLSANDKTIKLWRLSERQKEAYNFNLVHNSNEGDEGSQTSDAWTLQRDPKTSPMLHGPSVPTLSRSSELRVPRFRPAPHLTIESRPRRVFANAHVYHINAISLNCDQETFLSADDLRINLWHLDVSNQSFTIVDLKPPNMEDLSEVITCTRFHPSQCHLLAYSTSRGCIRLCDMRARALCDNHVMAFEDSGLSNNPGFFTDIIASLSDFRFAHSGQYFLARDYLTLKVWDSRMGDRPCEVYPMLEPFRSQLCTLYENDAIFDKFLCSWSSDDRFVTSGSYGNLFRVFDRHTGSDWLYDLTDASYTDQEIPSPLQPKRFLSSEDPVGSCLGLTTVCVAPSSTIDRLLQDSQSSGEGSDGGSESSHHNDDHVDDEHSSESNASHSHSARSGSSVNELDGSDTDQTMNTDSPSIAGGSLTADGLLAPPTGSKRRKQTLPTNADTECGDCESDMDPKSTTRSHRQVRRKQNLEAVDSGDTSSPVINGFDSNGGDQPMQTQSFFPDQMVDSQRLRDRLTKRGLFSDTYSTDNVLLPGLRQLDYQRKLLHTAWHPRRMKLAWITGNQLFLVKGESHEIPSEIDDTPSNEGLFVSESPQPTGHPVCAKEPKRRRRRSHPDGHISDDESLPSITNGSSNPVVVVPGHLFQITVSEDSDTVTTNPPSTDDLNDQLTVQLYNPPVTVVTPICTDTFSSSTPFSHLPSPPTELEPV